ncbi:hypothetical protein [Geminicoccus harenae]|uniref:hypothetical protein n=1 Tax=Geminicoccus harenae TaxID=2498453 RepID=UPI00168BF6A0|nr:hypothetical protein [Geminicoccus harenae]
MSLHDLARLIDRLHEARCRVAGTEYQAIARRYERAIHLMRAAAAEEAGRMHGWALVPGATGLPVESTRVPRAALAEAGIPIVDVYRIGPKAMIGWAHLRSLDEGAAISLFDNLRNLGLVIAPPLLPGWYPGHLPWLIGQSELVGRAVRQIIHGGRS